MTVGVVVRQLAGVRHRGATWIPAFAGMTVGVAVSMATGGQTGAGEGTWIPAFAGKTVGVAVSMATGGQTGNGEGTWIPAFAGKTVGVAVSMATGGRTGNGGGGRRGFRLSPERRSGWRCLWQLAGKRAPGRETWVPAFAGTVGVAVSMATGGRTPEGNGFRLSPERRGVAVSVATVGQTGPGGTWIPGKPE